MNLNLIVNKKAYLQQLTILNCSGITQIYINHEECSTAEHFTLASESFSCTYQSEKLTYELCVTIT